MAKTGVTIRGLDPDLLRMARFLAMRKQITVGEWMNEAITLKIDQDGRNDRQVVDLTELAEKTETEGVYRVPAGTVKMGTAYVINNHRLCAAGRKDKYEMITYLTANNIPFDYRIFWIH